MRTNVVSFSGGKDSTAMILLMLERGESIADVVFFDTGWEFPQMYEHLQRVEEFTGIHITRLRPRLGSFDYIFSEYPVVRRGQAQSSQKGRGWPAPRVRWCTGVKLEALHSHFLALTHRRGVTLPLHECVGIAFDEQHRAVDSKNRKYITKRFPLIEWKMTEADALLYCKARGFTWGGLYDRFKRVSCYCCALQSYDDLRTLQRHYPELYKHMLTMASWLDEGSDASIFGGKGMSFTAVDKKIQSQTLLNMCYEGGA